jgi:hypothetical protein
MTDTPDVPRKSCFVASVIGKSGDERNVHADWLLNGIILPLFSQSFPNYDVVRADKIATPGMIDAQIINHLLEDDLVIADMTFQNANVFYEIGIRHMVSQKPIIHMLREPGEIPFDVAPFRTIRYSLERPENLQAARTALFAQVQAIEGPNFVPDNPVTRARGSVQLDETATPKDRLILDRLAAIEASVQRLAAPAIDPGRFSRWLTSPKHLSISQGLLLIIKAGTTEHDLFLLRDFVDEILRNFDVRGYSVDFSSSEIKIIFKDQLAKRQVNDVKEALTDLPRVQTVEELF